MNKPIHHIHRLKLTTITPVCIGGNQDNRLSPYADYVVSNDGQHIQYINQKVLENAVMEADLLDDYVKYIATGVDNNRSRFDLRHFITGELKKEIDEVTAIKVPNHGIQHDSRIEFQPIAKSAGRAYLPGSSIKGALRTAMLYDWLVKTKQGESVLRSYFFLLEKWRDRDVSNRDVYKDLFKEDKLFGTLRDDLGQDSRRIRVSDSGFTEQWGVFGVKRIRLLPLNKEGQGSDIPMPREAILSNEEFSLSLTIEPPVRHKALKYLADQDTDSILKNLNEFTLAALSMENAELNDADNRDNADELEQLSIFNNELLERAEKGEVFIRIGSGKTIYDNSLALALYNGGDPKESMKAFDSFRKLFWKVKYADRIYPITRTVTNEGLPMGWVKVEKA